jgi:hypothetical protein
VTNHHKTFLLSQPKKEKNIFRDALLRNPSAHICACF